MNQAKQTDEWLMAQVAAGQRECLAVLVRRYASPLLTYIERMVGDHHRSEELFQEVFLRVWIKRRDLPLPPAVPGVAVCHRHEPLPLGVSAERAAVPCRWPEDGPEGLAASDASPFEAAVATETASLVAAAVDQLPPQQREVVVLRNFNGLSFGEIAEAVGCSEPTARSHMHHALGGLRRFLERGEVAAMSR